MFTKLRNNYNLSNVLARIFFVVAFAFSKWQDALLASIMVLGEANLLLALAVDILLGVGVMFLLPLFVNFLLNSFRLYTVPRAEYCLLAHVFFGLGYLICGALRLVNLFTPLLLVWGRFLFPFVSSLIAAGLFYHVTAKLYFNDVTKANYFKNFAVVYLVIVLIAEVL